MAKLNPNYIIITGSNHLVPRIDFYCDYMIPFLYGNNLGPAKTSTALSQKKYFLAWFGVFFTPHMVNVGGVSIFARDPTTQSFVVSDIELMSVLPLSGVTRHLVFLRKYVEILYRESRKTIYCTTVSAAIELARWVYCLARSSNATIFMNLRHSMGLPFVVYSDLDPERYLADCVRWPPKTLDDVRDRFNIAIGSSPVLVVEPVTCATPSPPRIAQGYLSTPTEWRNKMFSVSNVGVVDSQPAIEASNSNPIYESFLASSGTQQVEEEVSEKEQNLSTFDTQQVEEGEQILEEEDVLLLQDDSTDDEECEREVLEDDEEEKVPEEEKEEMYLLGMTSKQYDMLQEMLCKNTDTHQTKAVTYSHFISVIQEHAELFQLDPAYNINCFKFVVYFYKTYRDFQTNSKIPSGWFRLSKVLCSANGRPDITMVILDDIDALLETMHYVGVEGKMEQLIMNLIPLWRVQDFLKVTYHDQFRPVPLKMTTLIPDFAVYARIHFKMRLEELLLTRLQSIYPDSLYDDKLHRFERLSLPLSVEVRIIRDGLFSPPFYVTTDVIPTTIHSFFVDPGQDPSESIFLMDGYPASKDLSQVVLNHGRINCEGEIFKCLFVKF